MNRLLSGAAAFLVLASAAGPVSAAPDEEKLGKSESYPICPLSSIQPPHESCLVGMLSHFDTLVPARRVPKGPAVSELKRPAQPLKISYSYQNREGDTDAFLDGNRNTGLLVLKGEPLGWVKLLPPLVVGVAMTVACLAYVARSMRAAVAR